MSCEVEEAGSFLVRKTPGAIRVGLGCRERHRLRRTLEGIASQGQQTHDGRVPIIRVTGDTLYIQ